MAEQKERLQDRKAVPEELTWDLRSEECRVGKECL